MLKYIKSSQCVFLKTRSQYTLLMRTKKEDYNYPYIILKNDGLLTDIS